MSTRNKPVALQQKHWERKGQICRSIGLITYMMRQPGVPTVVLSALNSARASLRTALVHESRNNEFINLNIRLPRNSNVIKMKRSKGK